MDISVPPSEEAALRDAIADRYALERPIGRGATGFVWLARDLALERPVAMKVLDPDLAADETHRDRFIVEARTAARLSHPNIVPIHAVYAEGPVTFLVMGFVDGETLAQRVEHRGPLDPAEASRVFQDVAWAIAYAHACGIVHRDIKPENIIIDRVSRRALVTDFGIAVPVDAPRAGVNGQIVGTPSYMSPEQARGEEADARSDVYALGATVFFALTGRPPFEAPNVAAVLALRQRKDAPPLRSLRPDVPVVLADLVDRCLRREADDRPPDGDIIADRIGDMRSAALEIPRPVREFLRLASGVGSRLQLMVPIAGVIVYAWPPLDQLGGSHAVLLLWMLWIVIAELVLEPFRLFNAARKLQRVGIGYEIFREYLFRQTLDSAAPTAAPPRHRYRVLTGVAALAVSFAVLVVTSLPSALSSSTRTGGRSLAVTGLLFGGWFLGLGLVARLSVREGGEWLQRNPWAGPLGRLFFKAAAATLPAMPAPSPVAPETRELVAYDAIRQAIRGRPRRERRRLAPTLAAARELRDRALRLREEIGPLALAFTSLSDDPLRTIPDDADASARQANSRAAAELRQALARLDALRESLTRDDGGRPA